MIGITRRSFLSATLITAICGLTWDGQSKKKNLDHIFPRGDNLDDILSDDNLMVNPFFSKLNNDGSAYGWDSRKGAGRDNGYLGVVDEMSHKFPEEKGKKMRKNKASIRLDPSPYANFGIEGEGYDRSIWPVKRIPVSEGDLVIFSAYVMFNGFDPDKPKRKYTQAFWDDEKAFWVNKDKDVRGNKGGYVQHGCGKNDPPWCDRGGARIGIDFRLKEDGWVDDMRIADWTLEPDEWHHLVMGYIAPKDSLTVMPWIQGFEYNAPASVWGTDFFMKIIPAKELKDTLLTVPTEKIPEIYLMS